jgi:hypothetical protein
MSFEKNASFDSITESIEQLCRRVDEYNRLVSLVVNPTRKKLALPLQKPSPSDPVQTEELRLKEALREAVEELEESRKSFKSKRLENLRKKLMRVLMEN